jgi:hypothetical protein
MRTKIYILSTMLALNLSACTDIQDGTTDIDSWPAINEYTLNHPCMLHTDADFTYVKSKLTQTPWSEGLDKLKNSRYSYSNYTPEAQEILGRMDKTNWSATFPDWWNNYTYFYEDAAAAYQLALRWKLENDLACGQAAVRILNEWATTCKGLVRVKSLANDRTYDPNGEIADPNEYLISINVHQMVNAAEIMRTDETLFKKDELAAFQTMVKNVFYPAASDFLAHRESCKQHSWLNWDLAQMTSILSIGILCDDQDMINEAILYFKYGVGNGCIDNAVPFLHQDPDGHGMLGQGQESGRDQGHATLCVSLMGAFCQMAYNIGEDLFAYDGNKVLAMAEYTAKYNLWKDFDDTSSTSDEKFVYRKKDFPYTYYENCSWQCPELSSQEENDKSRGEIRPCWALIYNHYNAYYTKQFMDGMGVEGGGGHYGSTSGGFDQLGFGTLMYTRE